MPIIVVDPGLGATAEAAAAFEKTGFHPFIFRPTSGVDYDNRKLYKGKLEVSAMPTIREALKQFLAETGEGNPGSMSSPSRIIDLFSRYLDNYGHDGLTEFMRARFEQEYDKGRQFCDIFGPDHIQPYHINGFLSTFVIRKVMGTKSFLKACGPVMEKLADWLHKQGHWDEKANHYYRELVGEDAGSELVGCEALTRALHDYVNSHPVDEEEPESDDDYFNDQLTIKKVEPGKLIFGGLRDDKDITISLPKEVTGKARAGWSVTMEIAKIEGKWRILGLGNVYP